MERVLNQADVEVEVPMPEEMLNYLQGLRAKINANGGRDVDESSIVRAIVALFLESDIDLSECTSEEDVLLAMKRLKMLGSGSQFNT